MPPVRQAIKSASPAPERAAQPKASRPISPAAALQSRVGNGGVQQLIAARLTGGAGKATAVPGAPAPTGTASGPRLAVDTAAPGVSAPAGTAEAAPGDAPAPEKRRPAADNKAKGEAAPAAEGAAAKEAEPGERGGGAAGAPVTVELHMPEPPSRPSPATVKRIAGVKARATGKATAQAALPPGAKQVGDAQKAVTPPDAERAAAARAAADRRRSTPRPSPEIVKLCERIREVIRNEASSRRGRADGGQARGRGARRRQPAQRDGRQARPRRSRATTAPMRRARRRRRARARAAPLPPQPAAAATARSNATGGRARSRCPQSNVSLDKDAEARARRSCRTRAWTRPPRSSCRAARSPRRAARRASSTRRPRKIPAKVLAGQKEALGQGRSRHGRAPGAGARGAHRVARRHRQGHRRAPGRHGRLRGVDARQGRRRGADGLRRRADGGQRPAEGPARPTPWRSGRRPRPCSSRQFKDDLEIVQERVDERHSGVGGFVVGLWDAVTGLPGWAEEAYDRGRERTSPTA